MTEKIFPLTKTDFCAMLFTTKYSYKVLLCLSYGEAGEKGTGCESRTIPVAVCIKLIPPILAQGESRSLGN